MSDLIPQQTAQQKTVLIERVSNGWIVRPFQPCEGWATRDADYIRIYTSVEELRKDLGNILGPWDHD